MSTSSCSATTARPAQRSAWPTSRSGRSSRWKPGPTSGQDDTMLGQAIIVLVLVVGIPVSVMMTGAVVAGILGWALKENGEDVNRAEERRVGKESGRTCRSRWSTDHYKKK